MEASELFETAEIERGRRYHRPRYLHFALDLALGSGALALLAFSPLGDALHEPVEKLPWWAETPLFTALALAVITLVRLPLAFWSGYVHEHRFGLSTQDVRGWLADRGKAFGVSVVLAAGMFTGLAGLVRVFPEAWPVAAAAGAAALVLLLGFVAPIVLEPLFNRFERLRDEALHDRLERLAEQAGAPVREILVSDASRRTRKVNAYVSGLGASRRVVLFDTLLGRSSGDEVAVVVAHELAHRRERHVLKLTLLGMAGAAAAAVVLWLALGDRAGDPRQIPAVLLLLGALELAALPLGAALLRRFEREADRIALELTRDPSAFEAVFRSLAERNLADVDPPRVVRLLLAGHPSIPERIAAARRFATVRR